MRAIITALSLALLLGSVSVAHAHCSAAHAKKNDLETPPPVTAVKKDERKGETNDKIYRPRRANPVNFGKDEALLLFLQRIRDEAHRFAIRYHRQRRRKAATESILDDIPGIGPRRRRILLRTFGTIERIRAAPPDQLKALPGMDSRAVKNLIARLHPPHLNGLLNPDPGWRYHRDRCRCDMP